MYKIENLSVNNNLWKISDIKTKMVVFKVEN